MRRLGWAFGLAILAAGLFLVPAAQAQTTTPPPTLTAPALPALPLTPLATQLGQTLQTLVGTSSAQPAPAASAPDNNEDNIGQLSDSFATGILNVVTQTVDALKAHSANWSAGTTALPDFMDWLSHQTSDPHRQALWSDIGHDLLIIVGSPLLAGVALSLLLLPLRLKWRRRHPASLPGRIGLLIGLFLLRVVPVVVFMGGALLLLDQNETHRLPRFVILNIIYALSLGFTVMQILRGVFAPTAEHLRPFALSTARAVYSYRWLSAFSFIIVYGYFFIDIAAALRVPANTIVVLQNICGVILTIMAVTVIFQTRATVAALLRGEAETEAGAQSVTSAMREWLAGHWHNLTTAYLIIGLAVTLLGIDDGFALMVRGTILTLAILIAARLAFIAIELWVSPKSGAPSLTHRQFLAVALRPAIWMVAIVGIAVTWGFRPGALLTTPAGQRIVGAVVSIAVTLFILTVTYELLNASIERHLNRRDKVSKQPVASARVRTLLPMVRNSIFILFTSIAALICLAAVGVNIGPLLAGAGVVGVAIGFGSQSLVKDFLTGLFIVVENTVAVGDVVTIGAFTGTVEALSIRTIRLRDVDGSLHILPFSEVSKITNMTKGFAYALVDLGVAYNSDLERVMNVLREIGTQLQEDPVFKRVILEPIEVMGVENFAESTIIIRSRIRTRPGKQWDVRRLLLLRIQQRFAKEGLELPFPTVTHITKPIA